MLRFGESWKENGGLWTWWMLPRQASAYCWESSWALGIEEPALAAESIALLIEDKSVTSVIKWCENKQMTPTRTNRQNATTGHPCFYFVGAFFTTVPLNTTSVRFTQPSLFCYTWNLSLFRFWNTPGVRLLFCDVPFVFYCFQSQSIFSCRSDNGREIISCWLTELDPCMVISALFFFFLNVGLNTVGVTFVTLSVLAGVFQRHHYTTMVRCDYTVSSIRIMSSPSEIAWDEQKESFLSLMSDLLICVSVHHQLLQQYVSRALSVGRDLSSRCLTS